MHGAKTGNAKDLQRIEDMRIKVQRSTEDREIPSKEEMVEIAGEMEKRTPEDRKHVKDLIKCYWTHTTRAHKEAAAAASILKLLAGEVDKANLHGLDHGRDKTFNHGGGTTDGEPVDGNETAERMGGESGKSL